MISTLVVFYGRNCFDGLVAVFVEYTVVCYMYLGASIALLLDLGT